MKLSGNIIYNFLFFFFSTTLFLSLAGHANMGNPIITEFLGKCVNFLLSFSSPHSCFLQQVAMKLVEINFGNILYSHH
jgi:hypothetical protein